jgi:hypothetical protein
MQHTIQHQHMLSMQAAAYPSTLLLPCASIVNRSALYSMEHTGSISAMSDLQRCKAAAAAAVTAHAVNRVGGRQHLDHYGKGPQIKAVLTEISAVTSAFNSPQQLHCFACTPRCFSASQRTRVLLTVLRCQMHRPVLPLLPLLHQQQQAASAA